MPTCSTLSCLLSSLLIILPALAGARFEVTAPAPQPPGRLIVFITPAAPEGKIPTETSVLREYNYSVGIDATFAGSPVTIDDASASQPIPPSQLPPGKYLARSRPFGDDRWTASTVQQLGLMHTVRSEGGNQYGKQRERH
jgi:hypothetical protein